MRFPWRRRPTRLSRQLAAWDEEALADAGAWLESLRDTDDDGQDEGTDDDLAGMIAKAQGWVNLDDRCLDLSEDKPQFRHIPGCRCLVAIGPEGEHRH